MIVSKGSPSTSFFFSVELFGEQIKMTIFETTKKYLSVEECGALRYSLSVELKKKSPFI